MIKGIILKGIGGFYYVGTEEGDIIECKARGRFRLTGKPLVGDRVTVEKQMDGTGSITEIEVRKNELVRPALANLDQIVVVASAAPPVTDAFLIDKITAIAANKNIDVVICLNKCDIKRGDSLYEMYHHTGYPVLHISAETGEGVDQLAACIAGKISAFTGNSGVGKSSLLNRLYGKVQMEIGDISSRIGRGKHTTRHSELFPLEPGCYICDTPGFSTFETDQMELVYKANLQHCFPEFEEFLFTCRFTGCAHVKEADCAIKAAVAEGKIHQSRYDSYVKLYEGVKDFKEWEMKK